MTATALQELSGLSGRTLRDIEAGHPNRRYSPNTLAALDDVFGWPPSTAWKVWRGRADEDVTEDDRREIAEMMQLLRQTTEEYRARPPWAMQLIELARTLDADERRWVFDQAASAHILSVGDRRLVREFTERLTHG